MHNASVDEGLSLVRVESALDQEAFAIASWVHVGIQDEALG